MVDKKTNDIMVDAELVMESRGIVTHHWSYVITLQESTTKCPTISPSSQTAVTS
jgi:hypothetical protein